MSHARKPWVAFLLSLLTPGLGHVYNSNLTGGIVRYVVVTVVIGIALVAWGYLVPSVVALGIVLMAALTVFVGVAIAVYQQSRHFQRARKGDRGAVEKARLSMRWVARHHVATPVGCSKS